jgi:hypothetical protein
MLVPMPDDYPVPLLLRLRRAVPGKLRRRISSICVRVSRGFETAGIIVAFAALLVLIMFLRLVTRIPDLDGIDG